VENRDSSFFYPSLLSFFSRVAGSAPVVLAPFSPFSPPLPRIEEGKNPGDTFPFPFFFSRLQEAKCFIPSLLPYLIGGKNLKKDRDCEVVAAFPPFLLLQQLFPTVFPFLPKRCRRRGWSTKPPPPSSPSFGFFLWSTETACLPLPLRGRCKRKEKKVVERFFPLSYSPYINLARITMAAGQASFRLLPPDKGGKGDKEEERRDPSLSLFFLSCPLPCGVRRRLSFSCLFFVR